MILEKFLALLSSLTDRGDKLLVNICFRHVEICSHMWDQNVIFTLENEKISTIYFVVLNI